MGFIDVRTVLLDSVLSNGICVVVIGSLWFKHRGRSPGIGLWLVGYVLWFLTAPLIALRGVVPVAVSILLGSPLLIGALILVHTGLEKYTGKTRSPALNLLLLAVFSLLHAFFALARPSLLARSLLLSAGIIAVCGQAALLMMHRVPAGARRDTRLVGIVFLAFGVFSFARVCADLAVPPGADLLKSGLYDSLVILAYQMLAIGLAFALLLLVNRRLFSALELDIRERTRAEEALRESEEKFSLAFRTSPYAVAITAAADGRFIEVNGAFTSMTGFTREEALGGAVSSPCLWVDARDRERALAELACGKKVVGREIRFRGKDGGVRTGLFSAESITLKGEPCLLSSIDDITERNKVAEALAASETRYRRLFEAAQDGILILDADTGKIVDVNPYLASLLGYSHEQFMGKTVWEIGLLRELIPDRARFLELQQRGCVRCDDLPLSTSDGKSVRVEFVSNVYLVGSAKVIQCNIRDISARRRSEEELRRLSMAVEQSSAIVVISDRDRIIEYVNPRFTRVTGFTSEEALGREAGFLSSGDKSPEEHAAIWETISAGLDWHGEFHNRKKDGSLYWEQASISPMRDAAGAITHFIAVKEDVTAHRELESQFLQAQKMETVGRLAGGVAHDFNNMLQVISSYTEIALKKTDSAQPLHQFLLQIREAARRSADLTRQLLAFARKQTVSPRVLDLNEMVAGMLKMLRRLIGEDIDLAWMPGPELWQVRVDPSQVDQMLANLTVNSRDAISGAGKLTIETRNAVCDEAYCARHGGCAPGEYVMLTVSDNGCGMSEETMSHLFEPFFTTKGVGKGTGLGTATVYGIVKQNNGFINVSSEPGMGTIFRIYLPRFLAEGGKAPVEAEQPAPPRGTETVMFVEDEAAILELGRHMLEGLGYTVLTASSPGEALRLAGDRGAEIRLLITDVVMPEMNGRELVDKIVSQRPGLRCMFMSGYTADVIAHQGVLDEGVRFLQKPFSILELARKVRDALDQPWEAS